MASGAQIRLASIVGVDVAGYSARTEADAEVSAAEVLALRERLAAVAERHGGRIFNTAGDGVMMEFAAARAAMAAILEFLDERPAGEPAIRIGAHLGDVSVAANGDLLGHGVNVAARLIAIAQPGRAIVSGELKGAVGGRESRPMRALGEMALAKMRTKVAAFEIAPKGAAALSRSPVPSGPDGSAEAITIAVLPFVNMSSDPEQEYFSDGLSEELMNQLAQLKALRVSGRTSAFAFKGHREDLRAIGQKLGVGHIVEGSVRKAGKHLRITAQLIKCADGYHLWSHTYDRELDDVFAIQEEVARAVTGALGVTLGVREPARVQGGTNNAAAYDKYLRARALFHQSGPAELLRAIAIYREAVALDPGFALAWYGLHTALGYGLVGSPDDAPRVIEEMKDASARVAALAPDAWWTHALRADELILQHRWSEAEAAARAAVAVAPAEIDARVCYATYLMCVGRIEDAVASYRSARLSDPLSLRVSGFLQLFLDLAGRRDEAQAEYVRSKDLAGGRGRWELCALLRTWSRPDADPQTVRAQFRVYLDHGGGQSALNRAMAPLLDRPEAARAAIRQVFEDPANQDFANMTAVFLYADHFGDKDLALSAMRRAFVDFGKVNFEGLWWPFETDLRRDPRFKEIVRDVGLVTYWRTTGQWGEFARPLGEDDFEIIR